MLEGFLNLFVWLVCWFFVAWLVGCFIFFFLEGTVWVYASGKDKKGTIGFELFRALGKKFVLSEVGKDMKCKQISACIYIF